VEILNRHRMARVDGKAGLACSSRQSSYIVLGALQGHTAITSFIDHPCSGASRDFYQQNDPYEVQTRSLRLPKPVP
jgi:hypothetical protein